MPNWVRNTLKVTKGDPKKVFEFVRTEKSVIDFNAVIAMPDHIRDSNEEVVRGTGIKVPAWYGWSLDH